MSNNFSLAGHVALVTGAGRGIGAAVAKELAGLGCLVILLGRDQTRLQAVEADIKVSGGNAASWPADVSESGWLVDLLVEYPAIDLFVHCAAAFAEYGPLDERSDSEIQAVVDTSLVAALRISAALLPQMKKNNYGRLLFVGSRAANLGAKHQVVYAAAKGGLEALVKSLSVECAGSGIASHLLELGLIDTERTRDAMSEGARQRMAAATPAGRMGTPEEVAAAVRYLVSPDADYLRGVSLRIDGGIGLGLPTGNGAVLSPATLKKPG